MAVSKGQNWESVWLAHYDKSDIVTRNPQVAYLSSPKHFIVKNGQNPFGKQCFLKFQAIIAHGMTGFPWKCFIVSFSQWEQDSNLLDSNVVLEKPHPSNFEEAGETVKLWNSTTFALIPSIRPILSTQLRLGCHPSIRDAVLRSGMLLYLHLMRT